MIGYLDCSTGVSGDKFLGSLLDIGGRDGTFTVAHLQGILDALAPEARAVVSAGRSHGISGVHVSVEAVSQPSHRHWSELRETLRAAALPEKVRERAHHVFERLAVAEAAAHSCSVEEVHFHEVGALDSVMDVVGTCLGIELLGIDHLVVSPLATGSGTVKTSHGILPVPAPATTRLLEGVAVVPGPTAERPLGELTTPTGAALAVTLADAWGPCPAMTVRSTGFGLGTRDIGMPNVCMFMTGEHPVTMDLDRRPVTLLETTIDHLSGEQVGAVTKQLIAEGVLDVWCTPVTMKKGRPGLVLSVLAGPADTATDTDSIAIDPEHVARRIVALTGTLGVRITPIERFEAARQHATLQTQWGPVRFKIGPEGACPRFRPEADDVAHIASTLGQPYSVVLFELTELISSEFAE